MSTTYKIGEASALLNLKSYVLRFWETEFADIAPLRTEKGQRLYTVSHLALLQRIRYLLHDRGLTISGARKVLAEERQRGDVYIFQQPGDPSEVPSFGEGLPCGPALDFAEHDEDSEDSEGDADYDALMPEPDSAAPCGGDSRRFCQRSLPGLDRLMTVRASALDRGGGEEYFSVEQTPAPASPGPKGMLPLFAVPMAASCGGKLSNRGGDEGVNFIQPGGKKQAASHDSRILLHSIASELELVAALLRPGATTKTSPGVSAGNLRQVTIGGLFEK